MIESNKCLIDFNEFEVYNAKDGIHKLLEREKDVYRKGHFDYVLLYKRKPNKTENDLREQDLNFYGHTRLKNYIDGENDSNFLMNQHHKFHRFRICRIISPEEVRIEYEFDFPVLEGTQQHIFFSQPDFKTLLEI